MNNHKKILFAFAIIFLFTSAPAFSQYSSQTIDDLQKAVDTFSRDITKSLSFNSTMGLNWSDAFIGKLFPSAPPHFGFGFSIGATFLNIDSINGLLQNFDTDIPVDLALGLPLPGYTFEARLGGIILPFDVGFKFGLLPDSIPILDSYGIGIDYMLIGGDIRYSFFDKVPVLRLSAGIGINHLRGGISTTIPAGIPAFSFDNPVSNITHTLNVPDPVIGLRWKTTVFEAKAQASIKIPVISPYLGFGLSYARSEAGYEVKSNITVDGDPISDDIKRLLQGLGITSITDSGFDSMINQSAFNIRVYGGLSFNIAVIRLDFTGMYNFMTSDLGITLGLRFQL